jgi:ArsR family transcriptional regulator, lead/cadmium/zinc/bismuth-responsive transcriptional repressor
MVVCIGPTLSKKDLKKCQETYGFYPEIEEMAEFYNLISHPIRLKTIYMLRTFKEVCVCDLREIFDVTASSLSQHLAKLKAHKIVKSRKDAQTVFYSLTGNPLLETLPAELQAMA